MAELKGFIPPRDGPSQSGNNHREDGAFPSLSSAVTASSANDLQVAQGNPEIVTLLPYVPDPSQAAIAATRARDLGAPYSSVIKAGDTARDCYLPPAHQGSSLLNEYLHDFNSKIPLFSPDRIHNHVRNCYTGDADGTPLSWVLTYVVLGIAHRLRAMSLFAVPDDTLKPEMYLNKSLAVLPEMLLQEPSVQLVQALLGVSILLQTSGRANRAALFVSNAMYMAQDLGLNDLKQLSHGEPASDKESQYVFWITFMAHTDMSLATGRPSSQRLADISTPLPDNSIADWWNPSTSESQDELWKANIFALNTQLAVIQAEALEELFSVKAHQVPVSIRASAYNIIMSKLQIWRRQSAFASLSPQDAYTTMQHSDLAHWIILEAGYFRTLYQLHAASAMGGFSRRVDVFAPTSLRAIATAENDSLFCDQDARRFLTLAALMPRGNVSTTWSVSSSRTEWLHNGANFAAAIGLAEMHSSLHFARSLHGMGDKVKTPLPWPGSPRRPKMFVSVRTPWGHSNLPPSMRMIKRSLPRSMSAASYTLMLRDPDSCCKSE